MHHLSLQCNSTWLTNKHTIYEKQTCTFSPVGNFAPDLNLFFTVLLLKL